MNPANIIFHISDDKNASQPKCNIISVKRT